MHRGFGWIALALSALSTLGGCGGDDEPAAESTTNGALDAATALGSPDPGVAPSVSGTMAVSLRFKATIGARELVCGERYADQGTTKLEVKPQDFRFFLHNVRLIAEGGTEVPVQLDERPPFQAKELALLDFTDGRASCTTGSPESNMVVYGTVPIGRYAGIAFTTGVPEALNHTDPSTAPAPLRAPGVSWDWRQGYRFVLAELNVSEGLAARDAGTAAPRSSGGHGGVTAEPGLVFAHIGSTGCTGGTSVGFQCTNQNRSEIRLTGFDPSNSTVVADLGAVFASADLTQTLQCHARGDFCAPMFTALGVDLASGAPLATQTVYRVE